MTSEAYIFAYSHPVTKITLCFTTGKVFVGDSILSVNGVDLRASKHSDAARVMSGLHGEVTLELLYTESQESEAVAISASSLK